MLQAFDCVLSTVYWYKITTNQVFLLLLNLKWFGCKFNPKVAIKHFCFRNFVFSTMIWQELIKTALIGTERSGLSEELIVALKQQGIDTHAEMPKILLQSAGLYALLRKAGFVLQNFVGDLPKAIESTEENFCNQISIRHLKAILEGPYKKVLPEFIFVAMQAKKILPPEFLALIFQDSLRNRKLWHTAIPIIGARGQWLLHQNKAWKRLVERMLETNHEPFTKNDIYPVLENKFQIWGSDDVAFRAHPDDFNDLRAFWQSLGTRTHDSFVQKCLQILSFREEMIRALETP